MEFLPLEMVVNIILYLDYSSIFCLLQCSRLLNKNVDSEIVWRSLLIYRHGYRLGKSSKEDLKDVLNYTRAMKKKLREYCRKKILFEESSSEDSWESALDSSLEMYKQKVEFQKEIEDYLVKGADPKYGKVLISQEDKAAKEFFLLTILDLSKSDFIELLLERKVDFNQLVYDSNFLQWDYLLFYMIPYFTLETVDLLYKHGVNFNIVSTIDGITLLEHCMIDCVIRFDIIQKMYALFPIPITYSLQKNLFQRLLANDVDKEIILGLSRFALENERQDSLLDDYVKHMTKKNPTWWKKYLHDI